MFPEIHFYPAELEKEIPPDILTGLAVKLANVAATFPGEGDMAFTVMQGWEGHSFAILPNISPMHPDFQEMLSEVRKSEEEEKGLEEEHKQISARMLVELGVERCFCGEPDCELQIAIDQVLREQEVEKALGRIKEMAGSMTCMRAAVSQVLREILVSGEVYRLLWKGFLNLLRRR